MIALGIDSATSTGSVGLASQDRILGEYSYEAPVSQSERLLPSISLLLDEQGIQREELDLIGVSRGPGSFTGLRIGISIAKGLAHALDVPVRGIALSDAYYDRVGFYPGPVCVLIKDRRDLLYYAFYNRGDKIREENSRSINAIVEDIQELNSDFSLPFLLVGDGIYDHREVLLDLEGVKLADGATNSPSGAHLALLAAKEKQQDQLLDIEPLYAQRPIAEREWKDN